MSKVRAAIYARVSSAAQREAHTIDSQLHVLRPFVQRQGWTLAGSYVDDGRSAKTGQLEKREAFARLLADAEAGAFDRVVVVDVDRLTRTDDMRERAEILGPFQRLGIQIVTPSGGALDLRTMLGELYVTFSALVAAEENRKRAERIKAGKARAIAEGRKPAGPTPYGLAYSRAAGRWSLDEPAAAIVREIFARVIGGEACASIADDLHARGVAFPRRGGTWRRHFVWQIVRARTAVGEWTADKRTRAVIRVPTVVDEATWQAAQERLIAHGKRGLVKSFYVYLLQGLGTCGYCGEPIAIRSPTKARRGRTNPPAYVCRGRKLDLRHAARCDSPILKTAEIDARVWEAVSSALVSDKLAQAIERRFAARDADRRDWQEDVSRYERRLAHIERASSGIVARYRRGLISETVLDAELAASAKDRAAISGQLDRARQAASAHDVPRVSPAEWLGALRALADTDAPEERRRVVQALVRPGGAIFVDGDVELDLDIDEPTVARAPIVSVMSAG